MRMQIISQNATVCVYPYLARFSAFRHVGRKETQLYGFVKLYLKKTGNFLSTSSTVKANWVSTSLEVDDSPAYATVDLVAEI